MPEKGRQSARAERLLRARQIYLERLGISRSTFYDLVKKGLFPSPVRISKHRVGWRESTVEDFIASLPEVAKEIGA